MRDISFVAKTDKTVNGQYTFVTHDAVTAAVRVPCVEHGVVYYPQAMDVTVAGNRVELKMTVRFVNIDKPSDYIDVQTFGFGIDGQDKGPGKAMSYAMKYALLKTFGLETGDDVEVDSINHVPSVPAGTVAELTKPKKWGK
jgi:hypothetical protein